MPSSPAIDIQQLKKNIRHCLIEDQASLKKLLAAIEKRQRQSLAVDKLVQKALALYQKSQSIIQQRKAVIPSDIEYDELLPVSRARMELAEKIKQHQVLVLAGETGSGKTTQLPKICLQLGLGVKGRIGHTQPRRVAATSVARRIAEELNSPLGKTVGYSIRFNDQSSKATPVRLMTDGILLNEISHDPLLLQYDTLIIDEAHERSLNIDFLLGYLKNILPKRPDLKIIITSATIDLERFAKHFSINGKAAPIMEISGRTYPVDVWYRETDEENPLPQVEQLGQAVEEVINYSSGDILIFLSGEAEIRETAKLLRKDRFIGCEVLPLYARLSISEQEKIFKPSSAKRRIVLATNVAETSVTVPGIRFVIDPGFARISRYSVRNKIQRLPIEKISQASANQRKGRCGRVADGICIRLYSEQDFNERAQFTDAEILRTNLAAVILQMKQLEFGEIESFPFIDPPNPKQISDGLNLLQELQALDKQKSMTKVGLQMAKLPIEPRLARILLAGDEHLCLNECLIISAFLSVKDPREWPFEKRELAKQKHQKYQHSQSDFIAILNLWSYLEQQKIGLSNNAFKRHCIEELINSNAYREWKSTYRQLKSLIKQVSSKPGKKLAAQKNKPQTVEKDQVLIFSGDVNTSQDKKLLAHNYKLLHSCLMTGLLSFIGQKDIEKGYLAARQSKYFIHPQSVNFKSQPAWLMAFEVVETTQAYARLTAHIETSWVESIAQHLLKTHYYDAHWSKQRGAVVANMQQTLFGLKVVANRSVDYSSVEPEECRKLFILHALVRQELDSRQGFFVHNQQLFSEVESEIAKARQADLRSSEQELMAWFEKQLPANICNAKQLNQWLKKDSKNNNLQISLDKQLLLEQPENDANLYPEKITIKEIELNLTYHFEPGHEKDGVTVQIPKSLNQRFQDADFERLVPGILEEKIEFILRSLPKRYRKNFVPIPHFAKACYEQVVDKEGSLIDIISKQLHKMTGVILSNEVWSELKLPDHFLMRFELINDKKKVLYSGRSLQNNSIVNANATFNSSQDRSQLIKQTKPADISLHSYQDWPLDFVKSATVHEAGTKIPVFYAIEDAGQKVRIVQLVRQAQATNIHLAGCCRLILLACKDKLKYSQKSYLHKAQLSLALSQIMSFNDLVEDVALACIKQQVEQLLPYNKAEFEQLVATINPILVEQINLTLDQLLPVMKLRAQLVSSLNKQNKQLKTIRQDIDEQLDLLIYQGFVFRFGVEKVKHYKSYLQAIEKRIQKAKENSLKELQGAELINPWLDWYFEFKEKQKSNPQEFSDQQLDQLLWMIEEYRISVFAQGQKTRFPISDKRLQKFVDNLQSYY